MEPGPLPPHERTWRHPSELGPTSTDIDTSSSFGPHTKMLAAASGALAIFMIVAIVVSATPSQSDAPTAMSATTTPIIAFSATGASSLSTDDISDDVPLKHEVVTRHTVAPHRTLLLVSMTAIPNEIASAPQFDADFPTVAEQLPEELDAVMVQTDDVTYHCTWGVVELLEMPDGTMILDDQGELVAHVDDGEFIALVED